MTSVESGADPMHITRTPADGIRRAPTNGNPPACNAMTRDGDLCWHPAMANGKCHMHGGKSLSGIAHPNYKHGRRSKLKESLPAYLRERVEQAEDDWTGAVELTDIVDTQRAIYEELLTRLPNGESGETWRALREHWAAYQGALKQATVLSGDKRDEDLKTANQALESVGFLIAEGADEFKALEAIGNEADRIARIAAGETKRREKASNVAAMHMIASLLRVIQESVRTDSTIPAVVEEVRGIQVRVQRGINAIMAKR